MRAKNWMVSAAVVVSVAAGAHLALAAPPRSREVCDTVDKCKALKAQVDARLAVLLKGLAPNLTDIARDADGKVLGLNQYNADKYCREQGMRLPTARELALIAQNMGAEGISETEKEGFYFVKGSDINGKPDHFYFSLKGYERPEDDLGRYWFWSSSAHPDYSNTAFALDGSGGVIVGFDSDRRMYSYRYVAARCVR